MSKSSIPLASHIDNLMAKIAAEKKAEELGTTAIKSPENGDTKSIPSDKTYNDMSKHTDANATTANLGDANKNPGGEQAGSIAPILTGDEGTKDKPKSGKDVGETAGPKATDQGEGKTAALANEILKGIAELVKSASPKADAAATTPAANKEAAAEVEKTAGMVKEAVEKFPNAFKGGYEFAQKVASLLLQEAQANDPAVTKVAAEAENDAIKVAEFLMGFAKTAGDEMSALLGAAPEAGGMPPEAGMGGVVPPEAAMAGGADMAGMGGAGGMPGAEPSEEEIIQALADALQAEGITPEQLAEALAQEGGAGGGDMGGMPPAAPAGGEGGGAPPFAGKESPAEEAAEAEAGGESEEKKEAAKEASLRKTAGYKTASKLALAKIASLKAKKLFKRAK